MWDAIGLFRARRPLINLQPRSSSVLSVSSLLVRQWMSEQIELTSELFRDMDIPTMKESHLM